MTDSVRYDDLSDEALLAIDKACVKFEQDLRSGIPVTAEDYVKSAPTSIRVDLHRELKAIEREWQSAAAVDSGAAMIPSKRCQDAAVDRHTYEPEEPLAQADEVDAWGPMGYTGVVIAGRYKLQDKIGEGGMGEVWRAGQTEPVQRFVAVKLIKTGMDSRAVLQRFAQERQSLAIMDHPNIAKVYDGGITPTGQPFFVMELVTGLALTKFCDQEKLSPRARLELFLPICHAVQHAHQKGIIHRDLKPGNILVAMVDGKPVPRVIDFGVAKAIAGKSNDESMATQIGTVVGTLEYMSPEQAGSSGEDIDTRTDIYSLGVILYELLTGLRPFDTRRLRNAALAEMIQIIRDEEPSKPSTRLSSAEALASLAADRQIEPRRLMALLRGELDWIVMKCLEKRRERRYETANGLARDLQRYLMDEPVEARPPSAGYRLGKFFKRNKKPVLAAGLLLITLVAGIVGTTWGLIAERKAKKTTTQALVKATTAEKIAHQEAAIQFAINQFIREDILAQASSIKQSDSLFVPDPDLKIRTALDRAANSVDQRFADQPLVRAAICRTIGEAYYDLAAYSDAQLNLEQALRIHRDQLGNDDIQTLETIRLLGSTCLELNNFEDAEVLFSEAAETSRRVLGPDSREALAAEHDLANCYRYRGAEKVALAEILHLEILEKRRSALGASDLDVRQSLNTLALHFHSKGMNPYDKKTLDLAESYIRQVLDLSKDVSDYDARKLQWLSNLAWIVGDKFEQERALAIRLQVLEGCRRAFGEVHPTTARAMNQLATSYNVANKYVEAEELMLNALEICRELYDHDHPATENAVFAIGQFYQNNGKWELAEPFYRERLERSRRLKGTDSIDVYLASRDLALILAGLDRRDEAEQLLSQAIDGMKRLIPDDDPILVLTREYLADVIMNLDRFEEAEQLFRLVVNQLRDAKPHPLQLASAINGLGTCLVYSQRYAEAEELLREAGQLFLKYIPDAWPRFSVDVEIGAALAGQLKFDEAESFMLSGYKGLKEREQTVPLAVKRKVLVHLQRLYDEWNKSHEAARWRTELDALNAVANSADRP